MEGAVGHKARTRAVLPIEWLSFPTLCPEFQLLFMFSLTLDLFIFELNHKQNNQNFNSNLNTFQTIHRLL
jgi:hypothetical protein